MAALFTTPFDVIKTRLQTHIPRSTNQYDSVLYALYKINQKKIFYRSNCYTFCLEISIQMGLISRLIMYMSQGSLFFASYEFFKRTFSLEASHYAFGTMTRMLKSEDNKNFELTGSS
ncbi:hypothetical protein JHK82_055437 [Glycine max]|uniref:Uncharacterized protein n=2 Tax=Glycine subgen. Soja TaxID=1462606 RepID=K7N1A5_SOYBN|nr:hypothetical protein JHK86_055274 [Glycine max]KAG4909402.1 hypothetical protein JHK87_055518 [Glycine soja]KAG4917984.1 hypothetical protein JHK85_056265 [Glycine max]KAG5074077.1 hypothetical protein JHK84_055308 [Glycine max]KAG5076742.1 hypothetical protein JHK82_055437 [Glycine max]